MKSVYALLIFLIIGACGCSSGNTDGGESADTATSDVENPEMPTKKVTEAGNPAEISAEAIALNSDELHPFREGFAIIQKGESQAMINAKGDTVIPFNKYIFGVFQGTYRDNHCRLVRSTNKMLGYLNGLCPVGIKIKTAGGYEQMLWGCIDLSQKLVIPAEYQGDFKLAGDYLMTETQLHGTRVCLNRRGQQVKYPGCLFGQEVHQPRLPEDLRMDSHSISPSEQRIIIYANKGGDTKYGLADFDGRIILQPVYDQIRSFSEGLAPAMRNDAYGQPQWGYVDVNGKLVIDFKFSNEPGPFHCGMALVVPKDNTQFNYAYINPKGEVAIQEKETTTSTGDEQVAFNGGYAYVNNETLLDIKGNKHGFMRLRGSYLDPQSGLVVANLPYENYIRQRQYEYYEAFDPTQFVFNYNGRMGLANLKGDLLLPPIYNKLTKFDVHSQLAYAVYENPNNTEKREGYINPMGVFVIVKGKGGTW